MAAIRLAAAFATLLGGAAALSTAPAAAQTGLHQKYGETRAYFRDVLAACRPGGYCSVLSYNGAGPDAAGVDADYIFRVGSAATGLDYELIFTGVASYVAEESPITVIIDGRKIAVLEPGADLGWSVSQSVNEYGFSQSVGNLTVLPAMKAGRFMTLAFRDQQGRDRSVRFSLRGVTAALRWIERARLR